jgi:hypothetical protein
MVMQKNTNVTLNEKTKPLRTFSDQAFKKTTLYSPEVALCWYFLAPLLIIAGITGMGIYAAKIYQNNTPPSYASSDQGLKFSSKDGRVQGSPFLRAYLQAKGIKTDAITSPIIHFRGNYTIRDELAAFSGESDQLGNGSIELAAQSREDLVQFRQGNLQTAPVKVFSEETLAIYSLASCFKDPLYALALSPDEYEAEMHCKKELGFDVIIVNLVHKPSAGTATITVDAADLRIKKIESSSFFGHLTLKFQSYSESDGLKLPSKVIVSDETGMTLPIDFAKIDVAHNRPSQPVVGKIEYRVGF